jgi:hypothetical protein
MHKLLIPIGPYSTVAPVHFSELVIAYSRDAEKQVNLLEALKYGLLVHRNLKFKTASILLSVGFTDVYCEYSREIGISKT